MRDRRVLRSAFAGVVIFSLGVAAARLLGPTTSAPAPSPSLASLPEDAHLDAGSADGALTHAEPKIVFDPSSINLLPDASLRLELPPERELQISDKP